MRSMATQTPNRLNWLEQHLPEGLVVDSAWLTTHGYSTSLRSQDVKSGKLEKPTRQLYWRNPRGPLTWQQVVISLQTILSCPVIVGGRTALELQGYAHYLPQEVKEVHLYGSEKLPSWLQRLSLGVTFVTHNDHRLFAKEPIQQALTSLSWSVDKNSGCDLIQRRSCRAALWSMGLAAYPCNARARYSSITRRIAAARELPSSGYAFFRADEP